MKFTKIMAGAVLAVASTAFAAAEGATFTNEVSTDLFYINEAQRWDAERIGDLYDEFEAKYESDMFDFGLKAHMRLNNTGRDKTILRPAESWTSFSYDVDEWYVRYRPFSLLQVRLNDDEWIKGATLFSWDETRPLFAQKIGSGALDFDFFPIEGLKLSAGLMAPQNILDSREGAAPLDVSLSAAYEIEGLGTVSLTTDDLFDENNRSLGLYGNITAVENLELNAGLVFDLRKNSNGNTMLSLPDYFVSDYDFSLYGKTMLLAGVEYKGIESFTVDADVALAFGAEGDEYHDFFVGANAAYDISEALTAGIRFGLAADFIDTDENSENALSPVITVNPGAAYKLGNHTFKAGVAFSARSENDETLTAICFPLSWKYEF